MSWSPGWQREMRNVQPSSVDFRANTPSIQTIAFDANQRPAWTLVWLEGLVVHILLARSTLGDCFSGWSSLETTKLS